MRDGDVAAFCSYICRVAQRGGRRGVAAFPGCDLRAGKHRPVDASMVWAKTLTRHYQNGGRGPSRVDWQAVPMWHVAPIWDPGGPAFSVFEISNDEAVARCCLPVQSLKISSVKKKTLKISIQT